MGKSLGMAMAKGYTATGLAKPGVVPNPHSNIGNPKGK